MQESNHAAWEFLKDRGPLRGKVYSLEEEVGKILVVDDQSGVRCLLVETFKEDKYEVETAATGEVAPAVYELTALPSIKI